MRLNCVNRVLLGFLLLATWSAAPVSAADSAIDFNRDIRPILFSKCVICHGPDEEERSADLRLDTAQGAHEDLGGYAAVVPGDADGSEMILRVTSDDEDLVMPPMGKGDPLKPREIELLRKWIDQGGQYAKHWSYEIPYRPELPKVSKPDWPSGAIDYFTLAKMDDEGLSPSPQAGRLTLARRVAIDLTGVAAHLGPSSRVCQGHACGCLRALRRFAAQQPGFRRTLGQGLAGLGALRGFSGLRRRSPADHLGLSRLCNPRDQRQHAV